MEATSSKCAVNSRVFVVGHSLKSRSFGHHASAGSSIHKGKERLRTSTDSEHSAHGYIYRKDRYIDRLRRIEGQVRGVKPSTASTSRHGQTQQPRFTARLPRRRGRLRCRMHTMSAQVVLIEATPPSARRDAGLDEMWIRMAWAGRSIEMRRVMNL
jgi:hypothetical protein